MYINDNKKIFFNRIEITQCLFSNHSGIRNQLTEITEKPQNICGD